MELSEINRGVKSVDDPTVTYLTYFKFPEIKSNFDKNKKPSKTVVKALSKNLKSCPDKTGLTKLTPIFHPKIKK